MAESVTIEVMKQMLERLPGVTFCSRMHTKTWDSSWLYIDERCAKFYDLPMEKILAHPMCLLERTHPDDLPRVQAEMAEAIQRCTTMESTSRLVLGNGEIRWMETHANIERETDDTVLWYGHMVDVTSRKRLEQSLADSEAARARSEALFRRVIDELPVGVMVANPKGEFPIFNPAQQRFTGGLTDHQGDDVVSAYGIYRSDGVTPLAQTESGMQRCLAGEVLEEEVVIKNPRLSDPVRLHVVWTPLRGEGDESLALGTAQDITLQRKLENDLVSRNEELAKSEEGKTALIERLRYAVDELSNPILEVWDDVLVMPIIGIVDSRRIADMVQRLLAEVTRTQASFVIVDLTGVEIVDTKTADHLIKLMRKVEIVGARCVLTGIRPAVSETLVDIGVDFGRVMTLRNLKHGLREALRHKRSEREVRTELIDHDELEDELPQKSRRRAS